MLISNTTVEITVVLSTSKSSFYTILSPINNGPSNKRKGRKKHLTPGSSRSHTPISRWEENRPIIGFQSKNLIEFNNSTTRPSRTVEFPVSVREGKDARIVKVCFFVVPYRNIYNCLKRRSFLTSLDVMASTIRIKMKYHNDSYGVVVILIDLHGAHMIHKTILKNPHAYEKEKEEDTYVLYPHN